MRCKTINECFDQINSYFVGAQPGYFLLVNTERLDTYQNILHQLEADGKKKCVYVSRNCQPNGLPDVDAVISIARGPDNYALIGLSQALMFRSANVLGKKLDEVLGCSIHGHGIVLLDHCEQALQVFLNRDIRLKRRVVLMDGDASPLPRIVFAKTKEECIGSKPFLVFPDLLANLEKLTDRQRDTTPTLTLVSSFPVEMFKNAVYSVKASAGVYEALASKYSDVAGAMKESYGTEDQWIWFASKIEGKGSFYALVNKEFGSVDGLPEHLQEVWESSDKKKQWLLWLSLKSFRKRQDNRYLTMVLAGCDTFDSFVEQAYLDFADLDISDPLFQQYYGERKKLLGMLPENLPLVDQYCTKVGRYLKNEVFYLTDRSMQEKNKFVQCLSLYDYTPEEIADAALSMSKHLNLYIQDFVFDATNTKLPESDSGFRKELTAYFREYKLQKLTNRISPEFLEKVDKYAQSPRPYNKLQPRSSIISHMNREKMQCYFFDALGVEYLAFILAKCKEYGLLPEVMIGRCELPSITTNNKEFLKLFANEDCKKIEELDEVKHHSLFYDYRKCEYPLHLFEELDIIDKHLRKIHSSLVEGVIEKALIVADHGASRLAVRYGRELDSTIKLDESNGEHSGRCCLADEDPKLPFAAYEGGFAVLANYQRFKGGRQANVEVHGGASLEEVVVPIITLTKRPVDMEICFVNSDILLKPRTDVELVLYFSIPLNKPRLLIDGDFYDGTFLKDGKHASFKIKKIRRSGEYSAEVYDGSRQLFVNLKFKAQKQTHEVDLF